MARIRNIKPDYFRHEHLQDLEAAHPGAYIMLVYQALWTQCDANGIFPWKPRTLKLDILPFLQYDLEATMHILLQHGYIRQYQTNDGHTYGIVPTFKTHQRITGKEATEGEKYPKPTSQPTPPLSEGEASGVRPIPGNTWETPDKHPDAQGEERITGKDNREREGSNAREEEIEIKKQTAAPAAESPLSGGEGQGVRLDPYTYCLHAINTWARPDNWQPLRDYAQSVGYDPAQYGPVADEVKKFTAHWLDLSRVASTDRAAFIIDPAKFFQDKGRKWLLDAKNFNKPPKKRTDHKPKYDPPPRPRATANAHPTTHIGDLANKIITEIA